MSVRNKTLIAALPMYDFPQIHAANDSLWETIREHLITRGIADGPIILTRDEACSDLWKGPELLLAQACGFPLMKELRGQVQVLATPKYNAPGCRGAYHRSFIVVRDSDGARTINELRGRKCALNEEMSNSGMNLLRHCIAQVAGGSQFFSEIVYTGSHLASMQAIVAGAADVAAIDCVTFAHAQALWPQLRSLRILHETAESPSLPFITSSATPPHVVAALREALYAVARDPRLESVRRQLMIDGFETLPITAYERVVDLEQQAIQLNYPVLC